VGYHLEQAHRYRVELGLVDEVTAELAEHAAERLGAAGDRALARNDVKAAITLLQRSLETIPDEARPLERQLNLIHAHMFGGDFGRALDGADALIARAVQVGDDRRELRARLARSSIAHLGEGEPAEVTRPLAEEALRVFADPQDDAGLADAWYGLARIEHNACRFRLRGEALTRMEEHARRAGNVRLERHAQAWSAAGYLFGPFSVEEALEWYEENADLAAGSPIVMSMHARVEAMRGEFEQARTLLAAARERMQELGQQLLLAGQAMEACDIELDAGNLAAAAEIALAGCARLEELGERGWLSTLAGQAAQVLYEVDRTDEAWHWTEVAEQAGAEDDAITQMLILEVRAKLLARRGDHAEAERLAREAVALSNATDMLAEQGNALVDLAEVLALAGRREEAAEALAEAERLFVEKGYVVAVGRTQSLLEELRAPAA
jgi:tetratricopeptide (TPR) repeat protein